MKYDTFANRKASKPTAITAHRVSVGYVADTAVTLEVNTGIRQPAPSTVSAMAAHDWRRKP